MGFANPNYTLSNNRQPTPRTRAHIEGDLKAAERQVERLQEELAAVPPRELTLESSHHDIREPITFRVSARQRTISVRSDVPLNNSYDAAAAEQLRDWLNYYFPKGS